MVIGSPTVLNLIPGGVMKMVHVNQTDKNMDIQFQIMNGNQPFNVPEGWTGTIRGTKGDAYGYAAAVTVTAGSNLVTVHLKEQLTAVAGVGNVFELVFASTSAKVSTENFILAVEKSALNDETVISESDLAYANQVLNQLQSVAAVNQQVQQNKANIATETATRAAADTTLQNNINTEAAARQAADQTLQSNINAEASTRSTADASLQSQIDQLVAPSGEAPSAAEVLNARIGADGVTYPTLGDAIRTNDTELKSQLSEITGNWPYSFTPKTCIVNSGSTTTLEQVSHTNVDSAIIPCSEGDVFTISGEGLFNYRLWAFIGVESNSSYPVLSKADADAVANGLFITAPANTAYLTVNVKHSPDNYVGSVIFGKTVEKRLDALEPQIATIKNDVDTLADDLVISTSTLITKSPDSIEENTVYSTVAPNGTTLTDYLTDDFVVNGGEHYDITVLNLPSAPQYKVAMFYDANNAYIGYREREGDTQAQNNVFTTVPTNAKTMRISRSIYSSLAVKKYVPNNDSKKRVSLNGSNIIIDCNEFRFLLNKHGNNNLMDFRSVSDKNNNTIYQATSDWQGPYEVQAINNADGDAISYGMAYTGGNHAYNPIDGGLSGTPTARTSEYHVFADGVELNDGDDIAWSDCVKVSWVNFVQGWNTKKSDGTGREILKENPIWEFYPNGKVVVSNTIVALEDIKVDIYYGLQMQSAWADGGVFIPSATRERTSMSVFNAEGLGTRFSGNQTITYDSDVVIKMGFDPEVDLGNGEAINNSSIKETRVHATSSAGKLYVYMGVDYNLGEDEQMVYTGYYQFDKPSE